MLNYGQKLRQDDTKLLSVDIRAGAEKMYRSFSIKNFRCFDELTVEGMGRINLIAGKNNVGKTALLEALWVHSGGADPDFGFQVDALRGLNTPSPERFMANLFHKFNRGQAIELSAQGDWEESKRTLKISVQTPASFEVTLPGIGEGLPDGQGVPSIGRESNSHVVLDYHIGDDYHLTSTARLVERITAQGVSNSYMQKTQSQRPHSDNGIFLNAGRSGISNEYVQRYSHLEINGEEGGMVGILREVEPSLIRLLVEDVGGQSMIYADAGTRPLVPIQLMGDGMSRVLSLSLAIATAPGGIVLIDEIENGIHHSVMEKVWKAIGAFAHSYDVQLFATTHSYECIGAAYRAFESDEEDDLRLFRIERSKEGNFRAVKFDRERLRSVLQFNMEVI